MGFFKDLNDLSKTGKQMQKEQFGTNNPFSIMKQGVSQTKEAVDGIQSDQANAQNLMANGIQGQAKIEELRDTGMTVNQMPQVEMDLEVSVEGKEPYKVTHKQVIAQSSLGSLQPGAMVPVKVDPNDPSSLMVG